MTPPPTGTDCRFEGVHAHFAVDKPFRTYYYGTTREIPLLVASWWGKTLPQIVPITVRKEPTMDVILKTRNFDLSDTLRNYVEKKVNRLERFLPNIDQALVELAVQNSKSGQDRHVAQITLRSANGVILRAEERSADMYASIDAALDKMTRRIQRYKGKHWKSLGRPQEEEIAEEVLAETAEVEEETAGVVRTKTFPTRPMTVEEAIEQMELLGHDFFAFYNVEGNAFSVVYRRRNGGYGLLVPEVV